jgi:hypothetical protein
MRTSNRPRANALSRGERGGARLNFLLVVAFIVLAGYAGYNYAPVAYHAYLYKDFMQQTVNRAAHPPGQTADWVESQLRAAAGEYQLPRDLQVTAQNESGRMTARVRWQVPVSMPGFTYQYNFDHTARSSSFINAQ